MFSTPPSYSRRESSGWSRSAQRAKKRGDAFRTGGGQHDLSVDHVLKVNIALRAAGPFRQPVWCLERKSEKRGQAIKNERHQIIPPRVSPSETGSRIREDDERHTWMILSWNPEKWLKPRRLAGTARQYSSSAIPHETTIAFQTASRDRISSARTSEGHEDVRKNQQKIVLTGWCSLDRFQNCLSRVSGMKK